VLLKGIVHPKMNCHRLLALKLFHACICFFVLLNTEEDILKNSCNQTAHTDSLRKKQTKQKTEGCFIKAEFRNPR